MANIQYILRRLTFALEIKGVLPKINYFIQELVSLSTRIQPSGIQQVTWHGPKGELKLNYYDSLVCWRDEILDQHLYDIKFNTEKPIILDIGANQGFVSMWMKYNYPGAIIHAFEPVKKSTEIISSNIESNNFKDIYIHEVGVSGENKITNIYKPKGGAGLGDSVCSPTKNLDRYDTENITLINPDKVLSSFKKFDLLKLDAEGSEYQILKKCNFWKRSDQIIIEFHDCFKPDNKDYIKLIESNGFKLTKRTGEGAVYVCYFTKLKN
jgi:FkbM family methyltransferase